MLVLCRMARKARGRGARGYVNEVEMHMAWQAEKRDASMRALVVSLIPLKPSRVVPEVLNWMQSFQEQWGKSTRFPFLVLDGPSQFGKTMFAKSLFGPERTLVLSCQGVAQPNVKGFDRGKHAAIVMDEADHLMVFNNKQLFQSGLDAIMLAQSTCQGHAYSVWLYAVPIIVSTNDWRRTATPEQKAWLDANSVVVAVQEPLWQGVPVMPLADQLEFATTQ